MKTWTMIASLLLLAPPAMAGEAIVLGPHPEACALDAKGPSVLVHVHGFKDHSGILRVELYPGTEEDFLAPRAKLQEEGKVFERIDLPMPKTGDAVDVCVALPAAGMYTMSILHDRNANSRLDAFSDGYGFPNNPRLGYKKPPASEVIFAADGQTTIDVVLNYWTGFAARPIRRRNDD